jgi:hypothetical protein
MSQQVVSAYTFNPTARTITLSGFGTINLNRLVSIYDLTTDQVLFNPTHARYTSSSTNVITLGASVDLTQCQSTDNLQVVYDTAVGDPQYDSGASSTVNQGAVSNPAGTTLQSAATSTGNGTAASVAGYAETILHVVGTFSGTITPVGSSDGTDFDTNLSIVQLGGSGASSSTITAPGTYKVTTVGLQKLQAQITSYVSGSISVVAYPAVAGAPNQLAHQYLDTKLDPVNDGITTYPHGHSYTNITSATTTTIASGAGVLRALTINTFVASATIKIYDNTAGSGTPIATLTLPSTITGDAPCSIPFEAAFTTGLTVVTSGATDITVLARTPSS